MTNPFHSTIFPKDVLVFINADYEERLEFLVVSTSDGKHLDVLNLENCKLEGYRCLYGDTLIKHIEMDNQDFKFLGSNKFADFNTI